VDMVTAGPRVVLDVRRRSIGYVSQFLRVIPRVPALDIVAEPLRAMGVAALEARARARQMLERLGIPERLWGLSPVTFSGGEQQRVNVARVFVAGYPILLLDEPTASLDPPQRRGLWRSASALRGSGGTVVLATQNVEELESVADRVAVLLGGRLVFDGPLGEYHASEAAEILA